MLGGGRDPRHAGRPQLDPPGPPIAGTPIPQHDALFPATQRDDLERLGLAVRGDQPVHRWVVVE
jgi:hypothetical protein